MPPRNYSKRPYGIAYHGYYCGPGWSANQFQNSVSGGPDPIDALDRLCQKHDAQYANGYNRKRADREFYYAAMRLGYPKAQVAGILVGIQGSLRQSDAGVRHWSKRSKVKHEPEIQKTSEVKKENNSEVQPEMSRMGGLIRHKSFYKKAPGANGYMGGFVKTHKNKKNKYQTYFKNILESQGTGNNFHCVYLGHTTMPTHRCLQQFAYAFFRMLFAKSGWTIRDFQAPIPGNYKIKVIYRTSPSALESDFDMISGTGSTTLDGHVADFLSKYTTLAAGDPQVVVDHITYTPCTSAGVTSTDEITSQKIDIDLHGTTFHLVSKNTFKFQNRTKHIATTADAGEETTAVDTAPLLAKMYGGASAGMWAKARRGDVLITLIGDKDVGLIGYAPNVTSSDLFEPPDASYFNNCKRTGGFKMEPGEIKTNYLSTDYKASASRFLQQLAPVFGEVYNVAFKQGKYTCIAFEKALGLRSSSELQPNVTVSYELNNVMYSKCTYKAQPVTVQRFEKLTPNYDVAAFGGAAPV